MKPSQLAQALNKIAAGIQSSKKPQQELVVQDLKKVLASLNDDVYSCDSCGKPTRSNLISETVFQGMDTSACPLCRGMDECPECNTKNSIKVIDGVVDCAACIRLAEDEFPSASYIPE